MQYNRGFTLIEILVALAIFALVALIATTSLHTILASMQHTQRADKELRQLQYSMTLMQQDLSQTIMRSVTDSHGARLPAFYRLKAQDGFAFTRGGNTNPNGKELRSNLLRIRYIFSKHQLIRQIWPALDLAPHPHVASQILLKHVQSIQWQFADQKANVLSYWPSTRISQELLPKAVIVTINLGSKGRLRRVFYIAGNGYALT